MLRSLRALSLSLAVAVAVALGAPAASAAPPTMIPRGATDPRVTIVTFTDFQCPFSKRLTATLAQIAKQWPDDVQFITLMNPLAFHHQARPAALAALAAARQQRFWDYHDLLFRSDQRSGLKSEDLLDYARQLGLDPAAFKLALGDEAIAAELDRQQSAAAMLGVTGTPVSFINGKLLKGAEAYAEFAALIQAELDAAAAAGERGDAWVRARTKAENEALSGYLYDGVQPPRAEPKEPPKRDLTVWRVTVDASDPILGDPAAPVTLVVFSDFQCPFCERLEGTLDELRKRYGDKLRLVFKHNPLPFHRRALDAAKAAVCAQQQGKFWELHDLLFFHQRDLGTADLRGYARSLDLDLRAWDRCLRDKATAAKIQADVDLAATVGARGTPTTFVNGMKVVGARPTEELAAMVEIALEHAGKQRAAGTAPARIYDALIADGREFSPLGAEVHTFDATGRPRLGPAAAKVQLTAFSDFQCPFCSRVVAPLAEVVTKYRGQVSLVYKHFPLSFHKRATPAARYAVCAQAQGRFWPLHELLFANQYDLEDADLTRYAQRARLDPKKLSACLADPATDRLIEADVAEGRAAGLRGTPTLYVNGRMLDSSAGYSVDVFSAVIDALLAGKKP